MTNVISLEDDILLPKITEGSPAALIEEKLSSRSATIGVIGLGYVGLPLVLGLNKAGFSCIGFDIDDSKIDHLNNRTPYIRHIGKDLLAPLGENAPFEATSSFNKLRDVDVVIICVPTPLNKNREPDLSYIIDTLNVVSNYVRKGQLFILESTTWPGTTKEVMIPILERSNYRSSTDFFVAFSPEREDPGNPDFNTSNTPKVIGGDGEVAAYLARLVYRSFVKKTVIVPSTDTAEAVKLTENIFRSVNIALVNELKIIYDKMGIDVWDVIHAASTKPFGFMPFYPGPGLGGHCIPIDPFYLSWRARQFDINTRFIELAGEINHAMPHYVTQKLSRNLDLRFAKSMNGAKILLLGLAYKKDVDDTRETPAFKLWELLDDRKAIVDYYDPFCPVVPNTREYGRYAGTKSIVLSPEALSSYDAVLIVTNHSTVDYTMVVQNARMIVDTRNACDGISDPENKIIKA